MNQKQTHSYLDVYGDDEEDDENANYCGVDVFNAENETINDRNEIKKEKNETINRENETINKIIEQLSAKFSAKRIRNVEDLEKLEILYTVGENIK